MSSVLVRNVPWYQVQLDTILESTELLLSSTLKEPGCLQLVRCFHLVLLKEMNKIQFEITAL